MTQPRTRIYEGNEPGDMSYDAAEQYAEEYDEVKTAEAAA